MNRENKRKQYEKGYYKNHSCDETFTCKVCGRLVTPNNAARNTETIARTACQVCTEILNRATAPQTAAELCSLSRCGCVKTASGRLFTDAVAVGR